MDKNGVDRTSIVARKAEQSSVIGGTEEFHEHGVCTAFGEFLGEKGVELAAFPFPVAFPEGKVKAVNLAVAVRSALPKETRERALETAIPAEVDQTDALDGEDTFGFEVDSDTVAGLAGSLEDEQAYSFLGEEGDEPVPVVDGQLPLG